MGYLSFDVDRIQEYVFASYRPVDIHGASEWVKSVERDGEVMEQFRAQFPEADIVYAAGGSGLIRIPEGVHAARELEKLYREATHGSLTAVFHEAEKLDGEVFRILHAKIRRKKAEKYLETPLSSIQGSDPRKLCQGCGLRPDSKHDPVTGEDICEVCYHKRTKGRETKRRGRAQDLEKLKDKADRIALIYADLQGMGKKLEEWAEGGEETLRKKSHGIWSQIQDLVQEIVSAHALEGKYLDPVVGGDDLVLILPATFAIPAVERILQENETLQKEYNTAFSIAFVTAYYKFPVYFLFRYAKELLHEAKGYAREQKIPAAIHFFRLTSGVVGLPEKEDWRKSMGGDAVYPSAKPYTQRDFQQLLEEARHIRENDLPRTLLHNLHSLVMENIIEEERTLNLQYFLARHRNDLPEEWQRAIDDEHQLRKIFFPYRNNRLSDLLELLDMGA